MLLFTTWCIRFVLCSEKYQSVTLPNGIMADFSGPFHGRHHDSWMYTHSGLEERLAGFCRTPEGESNYYIFGDPAYSPSPFMLRGAKKRTKLSPELHDFHVRMSRVRVTVEWGFKEVSMLFPALRFSGAQRIYLSALGRQYRVAVILTNAITCFYGSNETSIFFGLTPPSIEHFLRKR